MQNEILHLIGEVGGAADVIVVLYLLFKVGAIGSRNGNGNGKCEQCGKRGHKHHDNCVNHPLNAPDYIATLNAKLGKVKK